MEGVHAMLLYCNERRWWSLRDQQRRVFNFVLHLITQMQCSTAQLSSPTNALHCPRAHSVLVMQMESSSPLCR